MNVTDLLIQATVGFVSLSLLASALYGLRLARRRLNRSQTTRARIIEIQPYFKKSSPLKTHWVFCRYEFDARGGIYEGQSIIPLQFFFPSHPLTDPMIIYDVRIEMPVFFHEGNRLVGVESVEHFLLQQSEYVSIRYMLRDPSRNFFSGQEELVEKRSERPIH